jgi:hypothetical protein
MFDVLDRPGNWSIRKSGDKLWIEASGFTYADNPVKRPRSFLQALEKLNRLLTPFHPKRQT